MFVIPGRVEDANPESRDSGSGANAPSRNDDQGNSQRHRLHLRLDRRQRLIMDLGLEAAQSLIDREQVDNGAPGIDEILEGTSDLRERRQDLLHYAERNLAGGDRRHQKDIRKDDISLQINVAAYVEVHEVKIKPEVVVADIGEQHRQRRRARMSWIIFAEHKLLAIGGFDPLIEEFDPRKA